MSRYLKLSKWPLAFAICFFQKKQMTYKDSRVKIMNEILNGIKVRCIKTQYQATIIK